jgi:hypothetical protein
MSSDRGVALILAVLATSFLSALGLGVALMVILDRLATGNLRGATAMLYAADGAIEFAARDLVAVEDWNQVLSGVVQSTFVDGEAGGVRGIPGGGVVDLTAVTNGLNCGKASACTPGQMNESTRERPWGTNNARWRLFAHGPWAALGPFARPVPCYVAVWVADDGREEDGDPLSDAAEGARGHGVLRVRAEAFGVMGSRKAIEAELARRCLPAGEGECQVGIRVQSWQEIRQLVP